MWSPCFVQFGAISIGGIGVGGIISRKLACVYVADWMWQLFWALGTCFVVFLAIFIMPAVGWRYLVAAATLPVIIFFVACCVSTALLWTYCACEYGFMVNWSVRTGKWCFKSCYVIKCKTYVVNFVLGERSLDGWGVKTDMVRVWVAGKTVWSPCYTRAISERFRDASW